VPIPEDLWRAVLRAECSRVPRSVLERMIMDTVKPDGHRCNDGWLVDPGDRDRRHPCPTCQPGVLELRRQPDGSWA
jgi:hypothetical protein